MKMKPLHNPTQEDLFMLWVEELIVAGYIDGVVYDKQVSPFQLSSKWIRTWEEPKILYKGTTREATRIVTNKETFLEALTYKPDFIILWNPKAKGIFYTTLDNPRKGIYFYGQYTAEHDAFVSWIDVKAPPGYGKRNNSDEGFRYAQKWVYEKFGAYVNKCYLAPIGKKSKMGKYLFPTTFLPERLMFTDKTMMPRKINYPCVLLDKFLENS